jgi:8-oxo-dGTP diphosphatase
MDQTSNKDIFTNKVRVRVSGILIEQNQILLAKHVGIGDEGQLWSPPGGGIEFGEPMAETLKREFLEETGLIVQPIKLLYTNEYIGGSLHAVEFFFQVKRLSGEMKTGTDPELQDDYQMIKEVTWLNIDQIRQIPNRQLHGTLRYIESLNQLTELGGILYFGNNSSK